jgi:hypothetical protein
MQEQLKQWESQQVTLAPLRQRVVTAESSKIPEAGYKSANAMAIPRRYAKKIEESLRTANLDMNGQVCGGFNLRPCCALCFAGLDAPSSLTSWPCTAQENFEPPSKQRLLDGFLLLEVCGVEFPDDVLRAVVNNRDITEVAEEDLQYFSSLSFLDIGENKVTLGPFGILPALKQLSMQCNVLRGIPDELSGFPCLETLDLSYNALGLSEEGANGECAGAMSVIQLARIPLLRRLDLACNSLPTLPSGLDAFARLECLSLDRNNLEGDNVIVALSEMQRLRELNLEYNFLASIPREASASEGGGGFPALEWLNMAHNLVSSDDSVKIVVDFPKLKTLLLYGNPVVDGPQPKDATGEHIPHTVELDDGMRVLEIVTMLPDNKKRSTGRGSYQKGQVEALLNEHNMPGASAFKVSFAFSTPAFTFSRLSHPSCSLPLP